MVELKKLQIEFEKGQVGDLPVVITVQEANAVQGMRRELLKSQAFAPDKSGGMTAVDSDQAVQMLRIITYPDCVAGTIHIEGMEDPSFDDFCHLPAEFTSRWAQAVYEVNPSWSGRKQETPADEQKKATSSGSK